MKKHVLFEARRQAVHFLSIFYVILSFFLSYSQLVFLLLASLFVAASAYRSHAVLKKIPFIGALSEVAHSCARPSERKVGVYLGSTSFCLGLLIVLIAFNSTEIFQVAALVLAFGDAASTMAGKAFGKHKIFFNHKKSLEGTSVGFLAAFLALRFLGIGSTTAAVLAAAGMLVEALPTRINDNLTIPVVVGILASLLL